jgi:hypothetical protein
MKKQIDVQKFLKIFYLSGTAIFLISGIANIFTNANYWVSMIFSAKVSAVVNNIFNFLLTIFFFVYYKNTITKKEEAKHLEISDIEKVVADFKPAKKVKNG